jgi:hypothetical protein
MTTKQILFAFNSHAMKFINRTENNITYWNIIIYKDNYHIEFLLIWDYITLMFCLNEWKKLKLSRKIICAPNKKLHIFLMKTVWSCRWLLTNHIIISGFFFRIQGYNPRGRLKQLQNPIDLVEQSLVIKEQHNSMLHFNTIKQFVHFMYNHLNPFLVDEIPWFRRVSIALKI